MNTAVRKESILIICDESTQVIYTNLLIEGERIGLISPDDSSHLTRRSAPDLIVIDHLFNADRELILLSHLKSIMPHTPFIFITDSNSEETVIRAFKAGVRDYIKKPFSIAELQTAIKRVLTMKRSSREKRTPYRTPKGLIVKQLVKPHTSQTPANILRVIRYIEENLPDNMTLSRLADEAMLSKYHFSRIFKESVGMSPKKFVTFKRIERAKKLFNGHKNISEIAHEVGFNDLSNFEKQFKRFMGMCPRTYKQSLRLDVPNA